MMKIIVLGSGTCVPMEKRGAPGFVLYINKTPVLIDSGSGSLQKMILAGVNYTELKYLLYSHIHPDHTSDLVPILFALNYTPGYVRKESLNIIGPIGFKIFFDQLQKAYRWIIPKTYSINVIEIDNSTIQYSDFTIESALVKHGSTPSASYRISNNNHTIVYSGDTSFCNEMIRISRNVDLLILESAFPSDKYNNGNHLTASQAGIIAQKASVKNLLLFHFYPICDNYDMKSLCSQHYDGHIILAKDLMTLIVDNKCVNIEK